MRLKTGWSLASKYVELAEGHTEILEFWCHSDLYKIY